VSENATWAVGIVAFFAAVATIGVLVSLHARDAEQTNRVCIAAGGQVILDNCVRGVK
jgi:hypothetical protein